jgi:orotate phosphoribosyltransferase
MGARKRPVPLTLAAASFVTELPANRRRIPFALSVAKRSRRARNRCCAQTDDVQTESIVTIQRAQHARPNAGKYLRVDLCLAGMCRCRERTAEQERPWSQEHLADPAGLSTHTIQRVEAEGVGFPVTRLALAAALDVSVSQLAPTGDVATLASSGYRRGQLRGWIEWDMGAMDAFTGITNSVFAVSSSTGQAGVAIGVVCAELGISAAILGSLNFRVRNHRIAVSHVLQGRWLHRRSIPALDPTMTAAPTLPSRIKQCARFIGSFKLRSGKVSDTYFDKYQFEADPKLLHAIAFEMAMLVPHGTEVLAGLEMGGLLIATMLSQVTGLPAAFIRKKPKKYGTCLHAEGAALLGRRFVLVENVVSSGGAILDALAKLTADGLAPAAALCAIDRETGGVGALVAAGLPLKARFTFSQVERGIPPSHRAEVLQQASAGSARRSCQTLKL